MIGCLTRTPCGGVRLIRVALEELGPGSPAITVDNVHISNTPPDLIMRAGTIGLVVEFFCSGAT